MAFTSAQLAALDEAIALGAREVWYGHKKVQYRSLDEMVATRNMMAAELANGGKKPARRRVAQFTSGWN